MSRPDPPVRTVLRPVQRADGPRSVAILAVSFGVTVVLTRLYLALTGWPQIGGTHFHLAHALWGGLLLMVAATLLLLWSNPWVMTAAAVCAGAGSGLFVDEVGKFITVRNDYFTPLAAPIIYLVILAVLGVVTLARRNRLDDARSVAYAVAVGLKHLADGPLLPATREALLGRLAVLEADPARPDLAAFAARLRPVVEASPTAVPRERPARARAAVERFEQLVLPRPVHRLVLAAGAAALGALSLLGLVVFVAIASGDPRATIVIDDDTVPPGTRPPALLAASLGEAVVGVLLLLSAVALLLGRDRFGLRAGRAGLVLGLAAVNVVLGYVSAETVVVLVVLELALLGLLRRYGTRFGVHPGTTPDPHSPAPFPPRAANPAASSWRGVASGR